MKFSGEGFGWKAPVEDREVLKGHIEDLAKENRDLDNENGLREWDQQLKQEEIINLEQQIGRLGIDSLTGAQRREVFKNELDRVFAMIRNEKLEQREGSITPQRASLIFLDLDKFKQVNDTHGHLIGDRVLSSVSRILRDTLRATDVLARYGGDEFIALLPNTNEDDSVFVAEKLRVAIDSDPELRGFGVTASIGVCSSDASTADDSDTFIKHADEAAYFAKRGGGNKVEVYR
ncbi:MAG: GGDEF domain-containing protein [Candidatus Kaiserbacteria bacterium]|nr:GGDEF domain-containing protein [Candidatus Kaiserbacteria bacterium]